MDWIIQVEKIAKYTLCSEIQLVRAKTECVVNNLIKGIPQSLMWETVKEIVPGI